MLVAEKADDVDASTIFAFTFQKGLAVIAQVPSTVCCGEIRCLTLVGFEVQFDSASETELIQVPGASYMQHVR